MKNFEVIYSTEAREFLLSINEKAADKILENAAKARYVNDPKLLKKLSGEIWELRTLFMGQHYRLLAFWDKRNNNNTLVIATHGFVKKTSKVPADQIAKALKIRAEYLDNTLKTRRK